MSDSRQIPIGWTEKRLRDVAESNPTRPKVEEENLLVSFIPMEDVSEDAKIVGDTIRPYYEVSKGYTSFQEDDLLIAKITPCFENGKGALAKGLSNRIGFGSTEFHILRAKPGTDVHFLYYLTLSHEFRGYGELNMHGSAGQKRVPTDFIRNYHFLCPSLPEQRAIAAILGTWDRAITLTERRLAAAEQRKKALTQQLLTGRVRFPEFAGEEWRELSVKEMGHVYSGGTPSTLIDSYWGGDIAWCTPTDITALSIKYISKTKRTITQEGLANSSAVLLKPNSILVCTRATIGDCAINTIPIATNQGFKNLTVSKRYHPEFTYYLLSFHKHRLVRYASGSTFLELSKHDFEKLRVEVPSLPEQRRIAAVLNACDREIDLLRRKQDALQAQKKGLMQRLLTGRVRGGGWAAQEAQG